MPIVINKDLQNSDFDLIFTNPRHSVSSFAIDYGDIVVFFLVGLEGKSTLTSQIIPMRVYAEMFSSRIVIDLWKVESLRFSMLEKLLKGCPLGMQSRLAETLQAQLDSHTPELVLDSLREETKALLRSYSLTEAPERNL